MDTAFPSYNKETQLLFIITEMAYDLYKQDWIDQHTTPHMRLKSIHDYYAYVQECMELDDEPESYEDYLFEYGFDGSLYVCYDEFCDAEYQDQSYITNLLNNDPVLVKAYLDDLTSSDDNEDDFDDDDDTENNDDAVADTVIENPPVDMIYKHTTGETIRFACTKNRIESTLVDTNGARPVFYPRMCKACFEKNKSVLADRYRSIAAGWCMVKNCHNPAEYYVRFETDELCMESEDE